MGDGGGDARARCLFRHWQTSWQWHPARGRWAGLWEGGMVRNRAGAGLWQDYAASAGRLQTLRLKRVDALCFVCQVGRGI